MVLKSLQYSWGNMLHGQPVYWIRRSHSGNESQGLVLIPVGERHTLTILRGKYITKVNGPQLGECRFEFDPFTSWERRP